MRKIIPERLDIPNSSAQVFYAQALITRKEGGDSGNDETVLFDGNSIIVLNGDFRANVAEMVEGVRYPLEGLRAWFIAMEKEWGSSWSKNSTVENWKLARNID